MTSTFKSYFSYLMLLSISFIMLSLMPYILSTFFILTSFLFMDAAFMPAGREGDRPDPETASSAITQERFICSGATV